MTSGHGVPPIMAPEKLRFFIWLIANDALPTNERRMRCGMATSTACGRCSGSIEDIAHCLRKCPHALEIWQRTGLMHDPAFNLLEIIPWVKAMSAGPQGRTSSEARYCARWTPPPVGVTKLNVDGSWFPHLNRMGAGGVLSDDSSAWLLGFSAFLGPESAMEAELWAICEGLHLAWSHGYRSVVVESDASEVVAHIFQGVPPQLTCSGTSSLKFGACLSVLGSGLLGQDGCHPRHETEYLVFPPPEVATALLTDDLSFV
ncbi:Ribonuclease H-like superfamily [Sesbania bispinosa]|nr:Ribonuclease H-like superfamily [Sesbania bispinosa]